MMGERAMVRIGEQSHGGVRGKRGGAREIAETIANRVTSVSKWLLRSRWQVEALGERAKVCNCVCAGLRFGVDGCVGGRWDSMAR